MREALRATAALRWGRHTLGSIGSAALFASVACSDSNVAGAPQERDAGRIASETGASFRDAGRIAMVDSDDSGAVMDAAADAVLPDAGPESPPEFWALEVATGSSHSCAVAASGAVYCWGTDVGGELGTEELVYPAQSHTNRPVRVQLPEAILFRHVTASEHYSCALGEGGELYCWGTNFEGQLGVGTTEMQNVPAAVRQRQVSFEAVSAGWWHACAVTEDGDAYCWGSNRWGQLGDGLADHTPTCGVAPWLHDCSRIPVKVARPVGERFVAVGAGYNHSCALTQAGHAYCWGADNQGQLGDSAGEPVCPVPSAALSCTTTPVRVALPDGVALVSLAAGADHNCGATASGEVYCWGKNYNAQLGDSDPLPSRTSPVLASALAGVAVRSLAASDHYSCGVAETGAAYCWGVDGLGQLGDGSNAHERGDCSIPCSVEPVRVLGSEKDSYVSIAATDAHTCAVTKDGRVECWGLALFGQLGDGVDVHDDCTYENGEPVSCSRVPVTVVGSGASPSP